MSNKEIYSRFKQNTEGVRVSQTKNTTWELINTHMDWDKQQVYDATRKVNKTIMGERSFQTEKSIWDLNNT